VLVKKQDFKEKKLEKHLTSVQEAAETMLVKTEDQESQEITTINIEFCERRQLPC
jgi:hypothetical protein